VDLAALEQVTAGGGIIGLESGILASFAIVSQDYMNINIRFGFHFVVVDTLCGPTPSENYISFRFEGGGGVAEGRQLRALLLAKVLETSGFDTTVEQDVIVARAREQESDAIQKRLSILGRLLAFTPLMDMAMHDRDDVDRLVREFMEMDEDSDG
jgi:pyruvate,water dikinase